MNDPATDDTSYLGLVRRILSGGEPREARNGATFSVFAPDPLRFDLSAGQLPMLTTKKVSFKNVFYELVWFLQGRTDVRWLHEKGVHIWDGNAVTHGSPNLGPIYGKQFRASGPKEIDQIARCLASIRANPYGRRHVVSLWNPSELDEMALPPCHGLVIQFFVRTNGMLDLHMYQRSADVMIGLPYNITSYSLLLLMMAHCTELRPGHLTMSLGDAHIYAVHAPTANVQVERVPNPFPQIRIKDGVRRDDPSTFEIEDFVLADYAHHGTLTYTFVV
ncbi:hypothetical protein TrST_g8622 [Triparma strigata]|uniref:thymidylate synthase n=1 Tax=Triparma strigata TaxID=1606541 RepID=A0A9W7BZ52_9STRA|nr:hypothetical protein TrST_g8622 [Triparma strigata]